MRWIKAFLIFFTLSCYLVVAWAVEFFFRDPRERREKRIYLTHWTSRAVLFLLGIRVSSDETRPLNQEHGNYLIVANHLSYLDVLAISATVPSVFVTSVEVRDSGFQGKMAQAAGSLFVERRNRTSLEDQIRSVADCLSQGFNVVLFPEGTSSSGEKVLPFKKSLFRAAVESVVDVLPVCVNYQKINGEVVTRAQREQLFYYGDMEFFPHFSGLLKLRSAAVQIKLLPSLRVGPESCRKTLADQAHTAISAHFVKL